MSVMKSRMAPLGSPAPEFHLTSVTGQQVSLGDFAGAPALLVAFLCNHCPYVRHIEQKLGDVVAALADLAVVGRSSRGRSVRRARQTSSCTTRTSSWPTGEPSMSRRRGTSSQSRSSPRRCGSPSTGRAAGARATPAQHGLLDQVETGSRAILKTAPSRPLGAARFERAGEQAKPLVPGPSGASWDADDVAGSSRRWDGLGGRPHHRADHG